MTTTNHLCDIWEHTIVKVFKHDPKSQLEKSSKSLKLDETEQLEIHQVSYSSQAFHDS